MRALVTGAAGFIGYFLTESLLKQGHMVVGIDNLFRGKKKNINNLNKYENFEFFKLDIRKDNLSKAFKNIDTVFHLAAVNGTKHFYDHPLLVLQSNVEGTINVLKECVKNKVKKIIFTSSSEVYHEPEHLPINENDKLWMENTTNPRFTYAASKIIGEMYVQWYVKQYGFDYIILRIFNTYGPRMDTSEYGQVIPEFISKVLSNKKFTIINDGTQRRSFCYIDDCIEMIIRSCKLKNVIMNIGNDKDISIISLAKKIHKIAGKRFTFEKLPEREGDVQKRTPDINLARKLLNYAPKVGIDDGLIKTFEWYENSN